MDFIVSSTAIEFIRQICDLLNFELNFEFFWWINWLRYEGLSDISL